MNNKPLNNTTPTFNNKVVVSGNKVVSKEKIRYKNSIEGMKRGGEK